MDPRRPGDDNAQPGLPPVDPDNYGPVAPEPEWERPPPMRVPIFNRERFLLRCIAWILGVQFGIFILTGILCAYGAVVLSKYVRSVNDKAVVCPNIQDKIQAAAGDSLAVLLALLGGGTMAIAESRRQQQADPRRGDRLPPSR